MSDENDPSSSRYIRRSSSLRSRPISSMPMNRNSVHSLYIEIASQQMARSRHQNIRDSLLVQLRKSEQAIHQAEQNIARLHKRIAIAEEPRQTPHSSATRQKSGKSGGDNPDEAFLFDY